MIHFMTVSRVYAVASGGRLFGLDAQLLHDAIILGINVFIIFLFLSYFVFNPARKMLEGRRAKIQADLDQALQDGEAAKAMKQEYEAHLSRADKEAEEILAEARRKAQKNEASIVAEAKEEASRIMKRADVEIERERRKALEGMKQEMVDIASAMAQKAVGEQMNVSVQAKLLEETLQEMGADTWQN